MLPVTRDRVIDLPEHEIAWLAVVRGQPSCALSLLAYWDRPWSSNAKRFACHALHRALVHGLNVLEA